MIIAILIMVLFVAGAVKGYRNKKQCLTCSAVTALNVMLICYMNYLVQL